MYIKFYYQIDFIDAIGQANYIRTFSQNEFEKAKEHYQILSNALACIKSDESNIHYVLDIYAYIQDQDAEVEETDILVAQILPELQLYEGPIMNKNLTRLLMFKQYNLIQTGRCPICEKKIDHSELEGDYLIEFLISGMCKECQDKLFND